MHRPTSKRKELIRRIAVYSLMTTTVIVVVTVAIFIILGYRFSGQSNTLEQGGLVQFESQPTNASIKIGNAQLARKTNTKITVNPGDYNVTISRDGYRNWTKRAPVTAGGVLWLNYARLIPQQPQTTTSLSVGDIDQTKTSANNRLVAVLGDKSQLSSLSVIEVNDATPKQTSLKEVATKLGLASSKADYEIIGWSSDSKKILVSQLKSKVKSWYIIPVDKPSEASKIVLNSAVAGDAVSEITFTNTQSDQLFALTSKGDLYRFNESATEFDGPIKQNVTEFSEYDKDTVIYVQRSTKEQAVGYLTIGKSKSATLGKYPLSRTVRAAAGVYYGDAYIAISSDKTMRVSRVQDGLPNSDSDQAVTLQPIMSDDLTAVPKYMSMAASNRIVVTQSSTGLSSYDIELDQASHTSLKKALPQPIEWIDRYHVYYLDSKGMLRIMDFDGANQQSIVEAADYSASLSSNGTFLYSFVKAENGYSLQQTRIILD